MKVYIKKEDGKIIAYSETKQQDFECVEKDSDEVQAYLTTGCSDCLEACKTLKKRELKETLSEKLSEVFIYNDEEFQTGSSSIRDICDYANILDGSETNIGWLGNDNTVKIFASASDFLDFRSAIVGNAKLIRDEYNTKRTELTNATTQEEVDAITWN